MNEDALAREDVLARVMAVIDEWSTPAGILEVDAHERDDFDAEIRFAVTGDANVKPQEVAMWSPLADFYTPEGDPIPARVTVTDV